MAKEYERRCACGRTPIPKDGHVREEGVPRLGVRDVISRARDEVLVQRLNHVPELLPVRVGVARLKPAVRHGEHGQHGSADVTREVAVRLAERVHVGKGFWGQVLTPRELLALFGALLEPEEGEELHVSTGSKLEGGVRLRVPLVRRPVQGKGGVDERGGTFW